MRKIKNGGSYIVVAFLVALLLFVFQAEPKKYQPATRNIVQSLAPSPDDFFVDVLEFSGAVSPEWINDLEESLQDDHCLMVIAVINSPGGGLASSMNVAHAFKNLQKYYKKPVVMYSEYGLYSGAYMVATSSLTIGISPGAGTGSIGVVMIHTDATKYWDSLGITFDIIRSGENKFSYSSINKLTPEQRQIIQDMIDDAYKDFINLILDTRYLKIKNALGIVDVVDSLKSLCDGRTYTAKTALSIGLVDFVCYFDEFTQMIYLIHNIPYGIKLRRDCEYYNIFGIKVLGEH